VSEKDAMDQSEMETLIRSIDARTRRIEERTTRIEQILPTFVTKDDAQEFATKDDLKAFATKDDLKPFATKDDVLEEGQRMRRHFDIVASQMKADIALIAKGHRATREYVDGRLDESRDELKSLDKRIMKLEAKATSTADKPKRRSTRDS
jgi:hypothetical protein